MPRPYGQGGADVGLVDGAEVLAWAVDRACAAGSFNTYNVETTRAIIEGAEAEQAPIFLAVGRGALDHAGFDVLSALCRTAVEMARVPVALHLDHATDVDLIERAVAAGFSSVMVDGSALPLAENIELVRRTRLAVGNRALEAELGGAFGDEDRSGPQDPPPGTGPRAGPQTEPIPAPIPMTDPGEAAVFVEATGVDSLAVAIGNVHGLYRGQPRLDLARLDAIAARVTVPLVLHGGTGLSDDVLQATIERGVRKINVNTELRRAFYRQVELSLQRPDHGYDLPGLLQPAITAMSTVVRTMIRTFRLDP